MCLVLGVESVELGKWGFIYVNIFFGILGLEWFFIERLFVIMYLF